VGSQSGTLPLVCAGAYSTLSTKEVDLLMRPDGFRGGALTAENAIVDVELVTLDDLIAQHGTPAFAKIDVEGFELEVFTGLSQPIRAVCFEANLPEFGEETISCIERYAALTTAEFNYTTEEPPSRFASEDWLSADALCALIQAGQFGYAEIYGRAV
jgi:Methyltransferase FkbM domain